MYQKYIVNILIVTNVYLYLYKGLLKYPLVTPLKSSEYTASLVSVYFSKKSQNFLINSKISYNIEKERLVGMN